MTSRYLRTILLTAAFLMMAAAADAREWDIVGPRALGMGGAGVAVANDATAAYWNPAAYGFFKGGASGALNDDYGRRDGSAVATMGVGAQIHEDLAEQLDAISAFDYTTLSGGTIPAASVPDFISLVDRLKTFSDNDARALTFRMSGGLSGQYSHYGAGAWVRSDISSRPNLDLVNIGSDTTASFTITDFTTPANYGCPLPCNATSGGLTAGERTTLTTSLTALGWTAQQVQDFINAVDYGINQAVGAGYTKPADIATQIETVATVANNAVASGGNNSFQNNTSSLIFKGLAIAEVPITYGYAISDNLSFGTNVKFMRGRTYYATIDVFNTDYGTALSDAQDNYKDSTNFGVDLAALYRLGERIRAGVVVRNVNSPSFDYDPNANPDEPSIKDGAQARAGVAIKPLKFLTLAADIDLTKNDTTVSSAYRSQNIGVGAELDLLKILKLRGGAYRNLAESDIGLVYTAGVGLKILAVQVDLGAALSSERSNIDGNSIPEEARAELAISALW